MNCVWLAEDQADVATGFLDEHFSADSVQRRAGRFRNLFVRNPGGFHVTACFDEGRIVGICCHLPVRVHHEAGLLQGAYGVDFFVAPAYRGRGIGKAFLELRTERFDISLSTGQSQAMQGLYRSRGASDLTGGYRALHCRRLPAPRPSKRTVLKAVAYVRGRLARSGGGRREPAGFDDPDLAAGLDRWRPNESGAFHETGDLAWRYGTGLYEDYRIWRIVDGEVLGHVVARSEPDAEVIVDVFGAAASRSRVLQIFAQQSGADVVRASFFGETARGDFADAGFLVRRNDSRLIGLSRNPELQKELACRKWVVYAGESDFDLLR